MWLFPLKIALAASKEQLQPSLLAYPPPSFSFLPPFFPSCNKTAKEGRVLRNSKASGSSFLSSSQAQLCARLGRHACLRSSAAHGCGTLSAKLLLSSSRGDLSSGFLYEPLFQASFWRKASFFLVTYLHVNTQPHREVLWATCIFCYMFSISYLAHYPSLMLGEKGGREKGGREEGGREKGDWPISL